MRSLLVHSAPLVTLVVLTMAACNRVDEGDAPLESIRSTSATLISSGSCSNGITDETFGTYEDSAGNIRSVVGCRGRMTWSQRGLLCGAGSTSAPANAWMKVSAGAAPLHDYWVNDQLGYSGSSSACSVGTTAGFSFSCGTSPMRLCTSTGTDPEDNQCNWTQCSYRGQASSFGGCAGNTTAGALCEALVPPAGADAACANGLTAQQYFGVYSDSTGATRPVVGCGGRVSWPQRACAPGWEPAPSLAWTEVYANTHIAPTYAYWTNDDLGYAGTGSGACSASVGLTSCGLNPMRVCPPSGMDPLGNVCNWTDCSDGSGTTSMHYGGCAGNTLSGVLCQKVSPIGTHHRPISAGASTLASNVINTVVISPSTEVVNATGSTYTGAGYATSTAPHSMGLASPVTSVTTAPYQTCVVTKSGAAMCSGWNTNQVGMLGDGTLTESPTFVSPVGLASGVADIGLWSSNVCALTQGGAVLCWGRGRFGQGQAPPSTYFSGDPVWNVPTPVVGLGSNVTALAFMTASYQFSSINAGASGACALTTAHGVHCWGLEGQYSYGLLGDGLANSVFSDSPVAVPGLSSGVIAISSGNQVCALKYDGIVYCWGNAAPPNGTNGNYFNAYGTVPTPVAGLPPGVQGLAQGTPGGGSTHQCAWKTHGIWCWGGNGQGQLGNGNTTASTTPVQVQGLPPGIVSWVAVGTWQGFGHTCAMVGGHVYCWGANIQGALGVGSFFWNSLVPLAMVGM